MGGTLGCFYLLLLFFAVTTGLSVLPQAFAPERERSTLGFLLLTPMGPRSIVLGKAVGLLVPAGLVLAVVAAWTLLLTVLFAPSLGGMAAFVAWGEVILTALALLLAFASASLALASLFPRTINMGCGAVAAILVIETPVLAGAFLIHGGRAIGSWGTWLRGQSGQLVWLAALLGLLLGAALCILLAMWGVYRMRKGDIVFEAAKRDN